MRLKTTVVRSADMTTVTGRLMIGGAGYCGVNIAKSVTTSIVFAESVKASIEKG
jgi:hypothetical protein